MAVHGWGLTCLGFLMALRPRSFDMLTLLLRSIYSLYLITEVSKPLFEKSYGGAGGYCPHVRRFILVGRLQV